MSAPKFTLTITDESTYTSGGSNTRPLYFITTSENKLLPDSANIAPGTLRSQANRLIPIAGQRELIQTFGIPEFQELEGNVLQGNELNEYGLHSAYSILGVAQNIFVVRADVPLNELKPTNIMPTSNVEHGTYWFDTANTTFGVFRANGNSNVGLAWDRVNVIIPTENDLVDDVPKNTYGSNNDIAVVTMTNENKMYEKISGIWYLIGSDEWSDQMPTSVIGLSSATYTNGQTIVINDSTVTLSTGVNVANAVTDINDAGIVNITASVFNGSLKITNTSGGNITLSEGDGTALNDLGFEEGTIAGVQLHYEPHYNIPSGITVGSIWIKTTRPNFGSNYNIKQRDEDANQWNIINAPMFSSAILAEIHYGSSLSVNNLFVKYEQSALEAKQTIMRYTMLGGLMVTGTTINPTVLSGDEIAITIANNNIEQTYLVTFTGNDIASAMNDIDSLNIPDVRLELAESGAIRFIRSNGGAIRFTNVSGTSLSLLGLSESEYSKWAVLSYTASRIEPRNNADEDTLWFNPNMLVDIMINTGNKWVALHNHNPLLDPMGVQITSRRPLYQTDGSPLVVGDLWINSDDVENYPALHRWDGSRWSLIDKSDQTTPFGILFRELRANAGPAYTESTHTPLSLLTVDLLRSDYVDPDSPDPRTYPAGMICFNMRYSSNNIKQYKSTFFENYPNATFTVGSSETFISPGYTGNESIERWVNISGTDLSGVGLFGRHAQRKVITESLAKSINLNEDIRSRSFEFNIIATPGYVELYDEMVSLNIDRQETAFIVTDTPPRLKPNSSLINTWAKNLNNATGNGENGRTSNYTYATMCYPWGLGSNVDGKEIMIPSSTMKLRAIVYSDSVSYPWFPSSGIRRGRVDNATSVGYLTEENEYEPVLIQDSLANTIYDNNINPIMFIQNSGLTIWGDKTMHPYQSALDSENAARLVCFIRTQLRKLSMPYFFELNTERTRNNFKKDIDNFLADLVNKEALYDFVTVCDKTNNTGPRIDRKELWADVSIEITRSINYIYVPVRILRTGTL